MEKIKIRNCSTQTKKYAYIVYRIAEGENWFWSDTNDIQRAREIVYELGENARYAYAEDCELLLY